MKAGSSWRWETFLGYFWNDFSTAPLYSREKHSGQGEGLKGLWGV